MLTKLLRKSQKYWNLHILKVLFTYRTAVHECTGYSPLQVNFGQSPNFPVDVMLGRVLVLGERQGKEIPEFVEDVKCSLKGVYDDVRQKLNEAH